FFFFQAEDGIRDFHVTGVQTCALPILPTYVEVDSITELNDNADLFGGEVIGIDPGAGLMAASDEAMTAYDLSNFVLLDGSDAAKIGRASCRERVERTGVGGTGGATHGA